MTIDAVLTSLLKDLNYSCYYPEHPNRSLSSYKVSEQNNNIVFKFLAPGIKKEDVDITFDRKKLIIKSAKDSGDKDFKINFNESISLYKSVDVDKSYANLNEGILTVTMPIDKSERTRKISFK
tara:strand:- start:649 stop:1017 length:369 start_codon:yes stop_codon:yes gene_type:complete